AQSKVNVLILGETGTGKEICARSIHQLGPRASQPFVALNSAALPPELFENELFGHGAGAFTGANGAMLGSIARANAGTLFLDEIGSLGLPVQAKLLRFLQEKQYQPLGACPLKTADVRVLAAGNFDFETAVSNGTFRRDLYYRLAGAEIQ